MEESSNGVLIAIDWENIRRGAQLYQKSVTPQALYEAMSNVGQVFGDVLGGKAFGDWSLRPDDGTAFTQAGLTLYHAPRTMAGKDRSDPSILLEVYDWLRDRDDCHVVILGSGDSDYQVLVDRARALNRRVILCAFSQSVARDMLAVAPLFPLEAELGIQLAEHGDVDVSMPTPEEREEALQDVLHIFIREMSKLESRMNFVGYSMLCNQWMLDWGIAWNEYECRRLVEDWLYDGIVERHDVPNPNNPQYPTSAVRLVRTHEIVRDALGLNRPAIANPVVPFDQTEPYYDAEQ
ncbi:MAG: NYN domain-containing protein [Dehalococcoidia bacterium]|nr:NYN domain-containing protein [Dehalococcoidia bacterium]